MRSWIGQLLMSRCLTIDVALYKHVLITWMVLAVMEFWDKFNLLTLVQNIVNNPTFDKKQSSSSLQLVKITYIPFVEEGILISLTNWHNYIKFCLVNLMLVKFILFRVYNCLKDFRMREISFCWSGVFFMLRVESLGWDDNRSVRMEMCFYRSYLVK